ncbi:MAG: hypothetical protein HYZ28_25555 [Myxococcales bacterium]|nr:hypothetical protein [Myxococcales bacterium]
MGKALRLSVLAVMAAALAACGRGAKIGGGKEGAASALFSSSGQAKEAGSLMDLLAQKVDISGKVTVKCPYGGTATIDGFQVATNFQNQVGNVQQTFTLSFADCASNNYDDPKTPAVETEKVVLNGSWTVTQTVNLTQASANVVQKLKGKVSFGGAFDDYIEADITQTVAWAKLNANSGSLTITLDGYIKTSTSNYTYANESVNITAGVLVAAEKA